MYVFSSSLNFLVSRRAGIQLFQHADQRPSTLTRHQVPAFVSEWRSEILPALSLPKLEEASSFEKNSFKLKW
jgi:hypothetical protein